MLFMYVVAIAASSSQWPALSLCQHSRMPQASQINSGTVTDATNKLVVLIYMSFYLCHSTGTIDHAVVGGTSKFRLAHGYIT